MYPVAVALQSSYTITRGMEQVHDVIITSYLYIRTLAIRNGPGLEIMQTINAKNDQLSWRNTLEFFKGMTFTRQEAML